MSKKEYKAENEAYLREIASRENIKSIGAGVLCEILQSGDGRKATLNNVVSVYYKGWLITGRVFDDNTAQGYPDAFRLTELIVGWQIAITQMCVGDKWRIYVPAEHGYGSKGTDGIPRNSTLIFEIELVSVV